VSVLKEDWNESEGSFLWQRDHEGLLDSMEQALYVSEEGTKCKGGMALLGTVEERRREPMDEPRKRPLSCGNIVMLCDEGIMVDR